MILIGADMGTSGVRIVGYPVKGVIRPFKYIIRRALQIRSAISLSFMLLISHTS